MKTRISGLGVAGLLAIAGMATAARALADPGDPTPSASIPAKPVRNVKEWDVAKRTMLAIQGYDPVAYFPEGGGRAVKGSKDIEAAYEGVAYRFASAEHKEMFLKNPAKYEPAHGGWCSYAMWQKGEKVEVDPTSFIVKDDRLFLFYDGWGGDTRKKWLKAGDHEAQAKAADAAWKKISGEEPRTAPTLRQLLDAKKAEFEANAPPALKATFDKGVKDVGASGVMATALKVGARAPEFELPDATGKTVSLASILKDGSAVLVWYRGAWCPYCNIQLHEYQKHLGEITAAGGKLVAISPQTPDQTLSTQEKWDLKFTVLSDKGNAVAKKFGIAYTLPKEVQEAFKGMLDLEKFNGGPTDGVASNELPLAVVFVIDRSGKIAYAFVDEDYKKRANVEDIVKALEAIKGGTR